MNIYIVEDDFFSIESISNNVKVAVNAVRYDWPGKYSQCNIIEVYTPDYELLASGGGQVDDEIVQLFEGRVPHVLILDWELEWMGGSKVSGDVILRAIDSHEESKDWNPYVIFTSSKYPSQLLDILGGKGLKRIFPTSIMLLEKPFLLDESRNTRSFSVVKDAMKQAMNFALTQSLELETYPFPSEEQYIPIFSKDDNQREFYKPQTEVFTYTYWKVKGEQCRSKTYSQQNIVAILGGAVNIYGIIIWENNVLSFELLRVAEKTSLKDLKRKFPFLVLKKGLLYNEEYLSDGLKLNRFKFGEAVNELITFFSSHVVTTEKYDEESEGNLDKIQINRMYKIMKRFVD